MSEWPGPVTAITLFTDDLAATKRFYEAVFELPIIFEDGESAVFRFGATLINLLVTGAAAELIEPAQVAPASSGARVQLTLTVDDVDAVCGRLAERDIALINGPIDRPWGVRRRASPTPRATSGRSPNLQAWPRSGVTHQRRRRRGAKTSQASRCG